VVADCAEPTSSLSVAELPGGAMTNWATAIVIEAYTTKKSKMFQELEAYSQTSVP
jgi:hypothetical protein